MSKGRLAIETAPLFTPEAKAEANPAKSPFFSLRSSTTGSVSVFSGVFSSPLALARVAISSRYSCLFSGSCSPSNRESSLTIPSSICLSVAMFNHLQKCYILTKYCLHRFCFVLLLFLVLGLCTSLLLFLNFLFCRCLFLQHLLQTKL